MRPAKGNSESEVSRVAGTEVLVAGKAKSNLGSVRRNVVLASSLLFLPVCDDVSSFTDCSSLHFFPYLRHVIYVVMLDRTKDSFSFSQHRPRSGSLLN